MGFDLYATAFACKPVDIATPGPVFGVCYEAVGNWVAVGVSQFFYEFFLGDDVAVVVAALPELLAITFEFLGGFGFEGA